jgi:hypothetical protein
MSEIRCCRSQPLEYYDRYRCRRQFRISSIELFGAALDNLKSRNRNGFLFRKVAGLRKRWWPFWKKAGRALLCLLLAASGPFGTAELVWRTVHLQPNHPKGSDDEAQSRPSRASRTKVCRALPLSFQLLPGLRCASFSTKSTSKNKNSFCQTV